MTSRFQDQLPFNGILSGAFQYSKKRTNPVLQYFAFEVAHFPDDICIPLCGKERLGFSLIAARCSQVQAGLDERGTFEPGSSDRAGTGYGLPRNARRDVGAALVSRGRVKVE